MQLLDILGCSQSVSCSKSFLGSGQCVLMQLLDTLGCSQSVSCS